MQHCFLHLSFLHLSFLHFPFLHFSMHVFFTYSSMVTAFTVSISPTFSWRVAGVLRSEPLWLT